MTREYRKTASTLEKLNIAEVETKAKLLTSYMGGILKWNDKVNLTAITDREEFIKKHFEDSLLCVESREFQGSSSIIDVGTGGGFPGIPLAVCFPEKRFILMDSLAKRLRIIDELCEALEIKNVVTLHGRAEDLAKREEYREVFDLCVSRAVANMSTLCEYCLPFVRRGGCLIAYKGPDCKSELDNATRAIGLLGGEIARIEDARIPGETATKSSTTAKNLTSEKNLEVRHKLIFINKINETPRAYPRKAGTPLKKPL